MIVGIIAGGLVPRRRGAAKRRKLTARPSTRRLRRAQRVDRRVVVDAFAVPAAQGGVRIVDR